MTEGEKIKRAIAQLQAKRAILGEDTTRTASAVLLQRLASLYTAKCDISPRDRWGMETRLVGRKAEFGVIKRRIESLTQGQGRFVSLIGEAGIGKSRLLAEVREHVCGHNTNLPVQWLEDSADSMGNVEPCWLFRKLIRRYADIAEQDDEDSAWHKLESRLEAVFNERSTETLPYLGIMIGLHLRDEYAEQVKPLNDEAMHGQIRLATERLFERIASTLPLMIVLEDLQWVDESSAEMLQQLLPVIYRAPILMLGISRPTVDTPHARLREVVTTVYHDRYDEISLAPLSPAESAELIANLLHNESHTLLLTDKVLEKARGNPSSIEKTIRSLIHINFDNPRSYTPEHLANKILATRSAIEGERKLVTVLFANMAGFASMVEKLDPEDVHQIINSCYRILMDEIHECEGTVNEFRGDGIMALFGAPVVSEDHAQRACYACLAIQKALVPFWKILKTRYGIDFKVRIGVNSGPLVVGTIGDDLRMDFTVQGDTTDLAARLETSAEPGTVMVSEQTYRLAKEFFEFEPLRKLSAEEDEHPVEVYQLKDKAYKAKNRSEREVYSGMVGRDQELSKLELQVLKAVNGEGSVVNLIGEAGIGKSRLLAELQNRDVKERVRFLEGRAISIGKNLSYYPAIDLLKNWAQIREDDSEQVAIDKLESGVHRVCPDQADEIFPFVATMMGMKLSGKHADRVRGIGGEPLEKLIFKKVRELIIRSTEITPLVIIMEDLHWADASSLLLLESVYRLALTQKVMFINVFRPGYPDANRTLEALEDKQPGLPLVEILIRPLDPQNSEALISNILRIKGLQSDVTEQIIERAGGNPFFIEEIVRSLIDEGAVKVSDTGFEATDKIRSVVIPSTINEVLMARIDRLDEESRNLVKVASVLGRSFFYRILADVVSRVDGLDDRLAYLKQIQILREQMRRAELEYSFQHALAQEAVYESIPQERRRKLHLKVAESIERIFNDRLHEFYGMLAYHYGRDDSLEKAEECLIKAGEEALKTAASNEALHYYQEALRIYRTMQGVGVDPEKVAILQKNIALAFFNRGRYREAVEHFDEALNYYWGKLPKRALPRAFRFLSSFTKFLLALYFPSRWFKRLPTEREAEAVDLFYKKAEALVVIDPKRFFVEFFFFYGTLVRFDLTRFRMGIGIFAGASVLFSFIGLSLSIGRRILDYARPRLAPDDAKQWIIYDLLDTQHSLLKGNWNKINEFNEDLIRRNLRIGETFWASQHCYWHGLPKVYQGRFDTARLMVTRLGEFAESYENDIYHLLRCLLSVHLLLETRCTREATAEVNRGIDLVRRNGWAQSALTLHALEATIFLMKKEPEEAEKSLDRANQVRSEVKAAPIQASFFYRSQFDYYLCRLEDSLKTGHKEASEHRRNAFKAGKLLIKTCQKAALYRTESCRLMGVYYWLINDQKGAFKWWHKAIREGETLGARPQLARTYAEMAVHASLIEHESSNPAGSKAEEYLQKAMTMFHDLGLHQDLENLTAQRQRERESKWD